MSVYDYEAAPPPPPMYQAKAVKDKSLKDEKHYELQWFDDDENKWGVVCVFDTKKKAELEKRNILNTQKRYKIDFLKYRIVRCVTKKEVVK